MLPIGSIHLLILGRFLLPFPSRSLDRRSSNVDCSTRTCLIIQGHFASSTRLQLSAASAKGARPDHMHDRILCDLPTCGHQLRRRSARPVQCLHSKTKSEAENCPSKCRDCRTSAHEHTLCRGRIDTSLSLNLA